MVYLLLIIFFIVCLMVYFPPKTYKQRMGVYISLGVVLVFFAGFRDGDAVLDYIVYESMFSSVKNGSTILAEPTFVWIASWVNSCLMLFVVYAIIGVSLKMIAIQQLTKLWFLSMLMYLSYFYILHDLIQIRVAVASGLLLLCVKPIYERDWKKFLIFAILGSLFHYSALVIFPLWFLGNKPRKIIMLLLPLFAYGAYFLGVNLIATIPIPAIQDKIEAYQMVQKFGDEQWAHTNVFYPVYLMKIAVFYILMWKYDLIAAKNRYTAILMKIFVLSIISIPLLATMPVVAYRINEFFGIVEIIVIPFIFYICRPKIASRSIVICFAMVMICISIFFRKLILL